MIGNRYLLDTNIISAWLKNDIKIAEKIENSSKIFIPVTVLGEMYYGAQYSTKVHENIESISKLVQHYDVLLITENTCKHYGLIKASLRRKGKPIPENDIWIASIATEHDLILVSRDDHFLEIEEITLENW